MTTMQGDELAAVATGPTGFASLGLRAELLRVLDSLGYEEPTPIQREAIPVLLTGRDVLGQAATGTGKTAAFALPLLERLDGGRASAPTALVLVPTRELAVQVAEAMTTYGRSLGARIVAVYGGQPIGRQLHALRDGAHVVVATPGRALDHLRRGSLSLDAVETVVLDEADEMLDMGFADEIEELLSATPDARQTVLFSATMPPRLASIAARHQHQPVTVRVDARNVDGDAPVLISQYAYLVVRAHKVAALARVLDVEAPRAAIVFCRTRTEVDELTETLGARGHRAEALHGGMSQEQRDRVMSRMRSGAAHLLIATDVAARGIDLEMLTHVVNFDVPSAPEAYVHRIGRVGRAGREGVAITIAEPREQRHLANIERLTRRPIPIAPIPTVADLHARRRDQVLEALRDVLAVQVENDDLAPVVDALAEHHSLRDVARAAIALAQEVRFPSADERDIPDASVRREPRPDNRRDNRNDDRNDARRNDRGPRNDGRDDRAPLFFGIGSADRVAPRDLVGAIANETGLTGRDIGPIQVSGRFSVVGVPRDAAERVIAAMRDTTIRGRKVNVRHFVDRGSTRPVRTAHVPRGDRPATRRGTLRH